MFESEAICILTAGATVDGRMIDQKIIDDIAETYNPKVYNARINEEHYKWSRKFGSVLSVEKRDHQLFAVLKPNSHLLSVIEAGQLLHTSCEFIEDFAGSGKAYLTGLALTDEPASLGTTEIHLSTQSEDKGKKFLSSGATIGTEQSDLTEVKLSKQEETNLLSKLKQLFSSNTEPTQIIPLEENEEMNAEVKELLQAQTAALTALTAQVTSLNATVIEQNKPEEDEEPPKTELETKVEALSSQLDTVVNKLSKITDENPRQLAGEHLDDGYL